MSWWDTQIGKTIRDTLSIGGPVVLLDVSAYLLSDKPFAWRTLIGIAIGSFITAFLRNERFKRVPAPQIETKIEDASLVVKATDPKSGKSTEQTLPLVPVAGEKID